MKPNTSPFPSLSHTHSITHSTLFLRHHSAATATATPGTLRSISGDAMSIVTATTTTTMSDCFSALLCGEDSGTVLSGEDQPECSSEIVSSSPEPATDFEESVDELIQQESNYFPGKDYPTMLSPETATDRADSIAWILKVQRYYGFHALTACLAVNYFDRVLSSRSLPQTKGWPLQLLSVACLSIAAKMEEPLVPCLLDLQVEGAKFVFEPRTITRMELLVLTTLDWRVKSITPFSFIGFFAYKVDPTGTYVNFLISRASQIIMSRIQDARFLEYWPSCIAAATMLCAARDLPIFSFLNPEYVESWCDGLQREELISCHQLMQKTIENNNIRSKKTPKFLPQIRVMSRMSLTNSSESPRSVSSSCSSSSSSSSSSGKRRRLDNYLWSSTDDDKESS